MKKRIKPLLGLVALAATVGVICSTTLTTSVEADNGPIFCPYLGSLPDDGSFDASVVDESVIEVLAQNPELAEALLSGK